MESDEVISFSAIRFDVAAQQNEYSKRHGTSEVPITRHPPIGLHSWGHHIQVVYQQVNLRVQIVFSRAAGFAACGSGRC